MIEFKKWFIATVNNDATMQGYLKDANNNMNVFPSDVDIQPEQYPCIIYQDAGITVLSRPQGMHVGDFQVDIYSIKNSLEVENIHTRLAQLINFKDSTTQTITGTLWWIRENMVRDMHEPGRRLWRKMVSLKLWYTNTDST